MPLLATVASRNALVRALDEVRARYRFALVGYVVMPEHVHLLIGEPRVADPSAVIHSLKLRVSKRIGGMRRDGTAYQGSLAFQEIAPRFWQPRFYDFNVWSAKKRLEKLDYMHCNPVTRGLVTDPKEWAWSSYACYTGRGTPLVAIDFVN